MNDTVKAVSMTLGAVAAAYMVWSLWTAISLSAQRTRERYEALQKAYENLAEKLGVLAQGLAPAAEAMRSNMAGIETLMQGVAKIASAQLEILQRSTVPPGNPFGRVNKVPQRDATDANQEHAIQQEIKAYGISREEAQMRMNGANDQSVYGESFFDNWRR